MSSAGREPETSAKPKKPDRPSRGDGRDALIDAAVRLAAREGMSAITLRAVAAEAGLSNGLIVHHFGTRTALVREALLKGPGVVDYKLFFEPSEQDPAEIAVRHCEIVQKAPAQYVFVFQALLEAIRAGDLVDEHRAVYEESAEMVEQLLERAGVRRAPAFASLVVAALDGLVLQQLLFGDRASAEERLAELHKLIRELGESE